MAACIITAYNARRAEMFGDKMTAIQRIIFMRSFWVHTEWQFSDRYDRISFSAAIGEGARFKDIKYSHPYRWDGIRIPLDNEREDRAMAKARELDGRKYDGWGLLSFVTKLKIIKPDPSKVWCAETTTMLGVAAELAFRKTLLDRGLPMELSPEQVVLMAQWHWHGKGAV
jgi:hypothetical protein